MNWEYITVHKSLSLNELGGKGWELCSVEDNSYILKRPMSCKNCKFYKIIMEYSSYIGYTFKTETCSQRRVPHECNGCEKFKSKDD